MGWEYQSLDSLYEWDGSISRLFENQCILKKPCSFMFKSTLLSITYEERKYEGMFYEHQQIHITLNSTSNYNNTSRLVRKLHQHFTISA